MKKTHDSRRRNVTGRFIREARFSAKPPVSQEDLSARLAVLGINLSQEAISRVESEQRYLMDYELIAIAKALHIPAWTLIHRVEGARRIGRPRSVATLLPKVKQLLARDLGTEEISIALGIDAALAKNLIKRLS